MKKILKRIIPKSVNDYVRRLLLPLRSKVKNYSVYTSATTNLSGIEIGGPSGIFKLKLPVYKSCSNMSLRILVTRQFGREKYKIHAITTKIKLAINILQRPLIYQYSLIGNLTFYYLVIARACC